MHAGMKTGVEGILHHELSRGFRRPKTQTSD